MKCNRCGSNDIINIKGYYSCSNCDSRDVKMSQITDGQTPQDDWQKQLSIDKNLSTELLKLRENSNYQFCRSCIKFIVALQWIGVVIIFFVGVSAANSYRTQEFGTILIIASIITGILNPYISHLWHLPFDAVDLLFEIKRNRK